mgnify:CR=1 FL=1
MKKTLILITLFILSASCVLSQEKELQFKRLIHLIEQDSSDVFIEYFNESNFDPNYRQSQKDVTLLFHAIYSMDSNQSIYNFLLEKGANTNFVANTGTVMHWALEKDSIDIGFSLIKHGYDPTIESQIEENEEPLNNLIAFLYDKDGGKELVKRLVSKGMDLNIMGKKGVAAIHLAVLKENITLLKFLKKNKANLNLAISPYLESFRKGDFLGATPLILAVQFNKVSIVKQLLKYKKVDGSIKNEAGKTALDIAIEKDNKELIKLLKNP